MSDEAASGGVLTGPLVSLLREVVDHLDRLLGGGKGDAIDLRALPVMGSDELGYLRELLGTGEVAARVEAMGLTEVRETALPAVWWVTYFGADGAVVAERIEIARVPEILEARDADIRWGRQRLLAQLGGADPGEPATGPAAGEGAPEVCWQAD